MRKIKLKLIEPQSSAAAIVASDDDLLIQILLRLPAESLLRFKCVSKHWLSLVTSPYFYKLRIRHPIPASGLILHRSSHFINPEHEFVPFNTQNPAKPPFRKPTFIDDPFGIRILQSCNGILSCCSFRAHEPRRNYYIYNPTTKQLTTLPKPEDTTPVSKIIQGINLAYDPSKSTHYKVICVKGYELASWHYQIEIYSSETRQWMVSGETFIAHCDISFKNGVYWNGAIHWVCGREDSLYFDVDQERLEKMPMPPAFSGWEESRIEYFGESCDHLHLIEVNSRHATLFNIYEMERDHNMWLLRYHVDLGAVVAAFPHMIRHYLPPTDYHHYAMFVLDMVRGDQREEDSFMVLHIPGKAIRYNFADKSFYELCDFALDYPHTTEGDDIAISLQFHWSSAFQYIESLCIF